MRPLWLVEQWAKAQWTTRKLVRACPVLNTLSSQCIRIPLSQEGRKFRPPHPGWRWWLWLQMTLLSLHCVQAYVNWRQWLRSRSYSRWCVTVFTHTSHSFDWIVFSIENWILLSIEFYVVYDTKPLVRQLILLVVTYVRTYFTCYIQSMDRDFVLYLMMEAKTAAETFCIGNKRRRKTPM